MSTTAESPPLPSSDPPNMASQLLPTTFADVIPIKQLSSHQYQISLEKDWTIGTVPNGGYTTSAFLICARTHMTLTHPTRSSPHPINIHLEFTRRTSVGPATFTVRDIKIGSRISNLHLTLFQDYHSNNTPVSVAEGYITLSNITLESGLSFDTNYTPYPPPLPANLPLLSSSGKDANYAIRGAEPFPHFRRAVQHIKMYLVPPSSRPATFPKSLNDQWIRFSPSSNPQGRWTNDALGFIVDMFPQIVEQYINPVAEDASTDPSITPAQLRSIVEDSRKNAKYWYPTMTLNLDVKKQLPEEGVEWLFTRTRAKVIRHGRFDLDIEVWDAEGELVAISSHSSLVVDTSRNLTRGGKKTGKSKL